MSPAAALLPRGVTVFERGWLSSNNVLVTGEHGTALVDSGYATHAQQTVALVRGVLHERALDLLVNTHLHSDHCGGNALLQASYPGLRTLVPPGQAEHVRRWDPVALTFVPTGQSCPRFGFDATLQPGTPLVLGDLSWQVHAAPGHDPNSVILFEPHSRTLLAADALWENGFGVVFQELEGQAAFEEVGRTLDLIESLRPAVVVPGHGRVFADVGAALAHARSRLQAYVAHPRRHAAHAAKVLLKFKLLELQQASYPAFEAWAAATPYFGLVHDRWFAHVALRPWIAALCDDLVRAGAAARDGDLLLNA